MASVIQSVIRPRLPARATLLLSGAPCRVNGSSAYYSSQSPLDLDHKKLQVEKTTSPKKKSAYKDLVFGREFSDHMLEIDWTKTGGWGAPSIHPYRHLSLDPSCSVFHYSMELFEGMKAYKDAKGAVRLFRPDMNYARLNRSATRLALPTVDGAALGECVNELLRVDRDWIPSARGYSLYLRPTLIGTQDSLGVGRSDKAKLFVIASPVGPYYPQGWKPVKLLADDHFVRAWPGGTGNAKVGGNYAPGIFPQAEAAKQGFSQVLWLFGPEYNLTEVGTMNLFVYWITEKGEKELVTPPLDGTILPGVTRDSILQLARKWNEFKVVERPVTMGDLQKAIKEGRVIEAFGAGTAAVVSPIELIHFKGKDLAIPLDRDDPSAPIGKLAKRLHDTITGIQYGEIPSEWSVVVD
eukprot:TRINITY_DN459_c0_g1_i1.p1 TRINITY_DN459_c0_g1~~TRINITY_DN459_c0_g1_i1.p1  ORF type:complete len:431 (+),score=103.42 TRINITY_DN459_c0_g1_i1:68-1294(+)